MADARGRRISDPAELRDALDRQDFVWRTFSGDFYTLEQIVDDHLLNIELHLLGRSSYRLPEGYGPDNPRWQRTYDTIRAEVERRGLELKESSGAKVMQEVEDYLRGGSTR